MANLGVDDTLVLSEHPSKDSICLMNLLNSYLEHVLPLQLSVQCKDTVKAHNTYVAVIIRSIRQEGLRVS